MTKPKNDTLLRALLRQPVEYTPVWLMRQAGRYLSEYNETRARAGNFLALCKNPNFATEVTMQPLARFPLDAAILFSDILTIPDAMGLGLYFAEGEGPMFERPLREELEIRSLAVPDPDTHLRYVMDAVSQIRRTLDNQVPLIGFSGSPFTLACYMVEGRGGTDFRIIKTMLYQRPELLHHILEINAQAVTTYLNAQIEAGAQAVMIFDTWGGALSHAAYQEFSLHYIKQIVAGLKREQDGARIPSVVFTKGGGLWLESIANSGYDAVGLDWTIDIGEARRRVGDKVALQGNLDPSILFAEPTIIAAEVEKILVSFGHGNGHVFNLGHGISQFTPPENAAALVEAVHTLSRKFH
ncbi:uroporphyrinogen decarboxylase [Nitrosomonas cryotolerans]|uniref:Uroporphyrinogen decarboxylase n=1 Tax=Nitrosomonas cryotolerans ATCC 49181 TaxID=1131553 RepID=A0A1N6IDW7_9PROT|nr:uroporphyrinogen decarboxylase [Nitrosomonas cryotolerans]SFP95039.1 uroporphyrinogen decarboxylase [Nitrosomonas cryotolerans]SIO30210.1 uroporphyrinogen decarboxylase [Nitrosomonas cryotolerans ATCC 49181]